MRGRPAPFGSSRVQGLRSICWFVWERVQVCLQRALFLKEPAISWLRIVSVCDQRVAAACPAFSNPSLSSRNSSKTAFLPRPNARQPIS